MATHIQKESPQKAVFQRKTNIPTLPLLTIALPPAPSVWAGSGAGPTSASSCQTEMLGHARWKRFHQ